MSKVVHLSDVAHQLAKAHCRDRGLRMSDWVGELIAFAIDHSSGPESEPGPPPREPPRLHLEHSTSHARPSTDRDRIRHRRADGERTLDDVAAAAYAAPPFWAQS